MAALSAFASSLPVEQLPLELQLTQLRQRLLAREEEAIRLQIAIDQAMLEIRALRHELRTGQTPAQSLAALAPA